MDFHNIFYIFIISNAMLNVCIDSVITQNAYKNPIHLKQIEEDAAFNIQTTDSTLVRMSKEDDGLKTDTYHKDNTTSLASSATESFDTSSKETTTITNIHTTISCTCGIFLGSQFVKGSSDPPKGDPVIRTTLERPYACNIFGKKQCLKKCLEKIVQHLPNSAKILCATLDRDICKEKAFLFVRNCSSKWHNTNLGTGREYCCKNGLPYNCPKK